MIVPGHKLWEIQPLSPFCQRTKLYGFTYGVGPAGYDIRCREEINLPAGGFQLCSSIEHFNMPDDLLAKVHDKSTWARMGLATQNTVIEPGWRGYLTMELTNHSSTPIFIPAGCPIAQIIFHRLEEPARETYKGKYQDQKEGVQKAILEGDLPLQIGGCQHCQENNTPCIGKCTLA